MKFDLLTNKQKKIDGWCFYKFHPLVEMGYKLKIERWNKLSTSDKYLVKDEIHKYIFEFDSLPSFS